MCKICDMKMGRRGFLGFASAGLVAGAISPMSAFAAGGPAESGDGAAGVYAATACGDCGWRIPFGGADSGELCEVSCHPAAESGRVDPPRGR